MGLMRSLSISNAKKILNPYSLVKENRSSSSSDGRVPKGHLPVYVGEHKEEKKRFVIPVSYINHPLFMGFIKRAEEEFGFNPQMGALTIPCKEEAFLGLISSGLNGKVDKHKILPF
ncbi:PREDICTED: auxin-responsive protein SAUR21-like [Tarenaya hassleriana]|uniref:auxin-responsive protein SAUR21-like n=1 Tax=Tarenaya hassleriana TaxID=28532 RepID=UPI00053C4D37|nr:PREDICTED: auxin-responsive protein SAUR21-like [Tarenaya hassleriana]